MVAARKDDDRIVINIGICVVRKFYQIDNMRRLLCPTANLAIFTLWAYFAANRWALVTARHLLCTPLREDILERSQTLVINHSCSSHLYLPCYMAYVNREPHRQGGNDLCAHIASRNHEYKKSTVHHGKIRQIKERR